MLAIIFSAAAIVILNTQLMSLFERTGEIGVLRALGMGPFRVAGMIGLETLGLAGVAAGGGILGGAALGGWLQAHGWDLSAYGGGFSMAGVTFDPSLRAELSWKGFLEPTVVMVLVTAAASVIPMARAMRIPPAAAMKERK
jgi:ABC-type antimicrobial peptide transport system permease subunit